MKKQKGKVETKIPQPFVWFFALISLVIVPLVYYEPAVDVSLVPKFTLLSGLLLLILISFLLFKKWEIDFLRHFRSWPVTIWAGFAFISLVSLAIAINPSEGVFDALRVFGSFILLLVMLEFLRKGGSVKPFILSAMLLSLVFSCVGFYQYFIHVFRSVDLESLYKVNGMMSHKNVFSITLFLTLPFMLYQAFTAKPSGRIVANVLVFLNVTVQFLIQTRSVWLAMVVFMLVFLAGLFLLRKRMDKEKKLMVRSLGIILGVFVIGFLAAYLLNGYSVRNPKQEAPVVIKEKIENLDKRVSSIFSTGTPNRIKRLDIWSRTLEMIADHPVLGVGAGNWKIAAPEYYQPDPDESFYHNWRRPHNDFLWVFAEKGIVGFILYLGFFIALLAAAIRAFRREIPTERKLLVILMLGGIGGYCVDACFSFPYDRVETQLYMMVIAAILIWATSGTNPAPAKAHGRNSRLAILTAGILLVAAFVMSLQIIRSEKYIKFAHQAFVTSQWQVVLEATAQAESSWGNLDPVNNPHAWYRGHARMALGDLDAAILDLETAMEQNPNSVAALGDLGVVLYMKKEYARAIEYFDKALKIYPLNRQVLKMKGMAHFALEQYKESVECYYLCITDKPNPELDSLIAQVHEKLYGAGSVPN